MLVKNTSEAVKEKLLEEQKQKELQDKEEMESMCRKHNVDTVYKLLVPKDDTYQLFAVGWLKKPSRTAVSLSMSLEERDPLKSKEIVLRDAWLEGDQEILSNDELFYSAATQVEKLVNIRIALIKKNSLSSQ